MSNAFGYGYPAGAEHDPDAPYNQVEVPDHDFDVTVAQTLVKSTIVTTNKYIPEFDEETGHVDCDTYDTDWAEEYSNDDHYTPLELINEFKKYLEEEWDVLKNAAEANDVETKMKKRKIAHLIEECEDWAEEDFEITED